MDQKLLSIALLAAAAWAQKPGAVEGAVTNSVTGAPVKKALVTLRKLSANSGYQAMTDAGGRFRIDNVAPGEYGLWAEAQGYVRDAFRLFAPSQAVTVAPEKTIRDFAIKLEPVGAIAGRVLDENGDPVSGANVDGLRHSYSDQGVHLGHWALATTNDRGEYRLFDLEPGRWYVRVTKKVAYVAGTGRVHRGVAEAEYGETFYPGVARVEEAPPTEVAPGAEVSQIDIRIRKARVFRVRGKVIDGRTGALAVKARVTIGDMGSVDSRPDGTFDARGIPRGSYRLWADIAGQSPLISDVQEVVVADRDVDELVLRLHPLLTIQGMAVGEGSAAGKAGGARLTLAPLGGLLEASRVAIGDDGRFAIPNLAAQAYQVTVDRLGKGLYLKSARLGDQEWTDGRIDITAGGGPLTLVVAGDSGRVEGTVQSAGPGPAPVVVTLAGASFAQTVDTESDGSFKFECVPPGEYKVFAWELADEGISLHAQFRKLLESKAAAVTVKPGQAASVAPKTITAAEVAEARGRLR